MDGQHRIEQVREADALRFGNQAEQRTITVKTPRAALLDDFQRGLVIPIEKLVGNLAVGGFVGQLECELRANWGTKHPSGRV